MLLITKPIAAKFEKTPLYSQDGKGLKAKVLAKFFLTASDFTFYVLEAEKQKNGDWLFFGICTLNGETEYGYQLYSEIAALHNRFGLGVERDRYFEGRVADIEPHELKRIHLID